MSAYRVAVLSLLIAFAVRAGLPPGFMIAVANAADDGGIQIVICTSQGTGYITIDAAGDPVSGDDHDLQAQVCEYGPPPSAMTAASAVSDAVERTASRLRHQRARIYALRARVREFRLARGPPAHA